ncbi:NmrA/HSCARG family protein [Prochlorococcus marinus]|uniref:NmrA/HSCARG family protein n=1 Tax=Prochlorococcus marinus TaxID=1219 RepID=UPI001FD77625|nr:NmrA/HSCARG family protein [Prochlorococcus marinus]
MDLSPQVDLSHGDLSSYEELNQKNSRPVIAVTMASSRQGSSVVRHLSQSGIFQIRAITRSPYSKRAKVLANLPNVEIVQGDLLEPESLKRVFSGVYGIFGNTTPTKGWLLGRGSMVREYEIEQGRNLVDVVKQLADLGTLKHFVFSSICKPKDPLKNEPAPGHFTSKWNIEEYILINGLKKLSTILRPVSYFENFDSDLPGVKISESIFPGIVHKNKVWQTIAVDDVGLWTRAVFEHPKRFWGESMNIAGEEMTGQEMAALWQKINPKEFSSVRYSMVPRKLMNFIEHDIALMASWIERAGYGADLKALKVLANELDITMTSLSCWLKGKASINTKKRLPNIDLQRSFTPITLAPKKEGPINI